MAVRVHPVGLVLLGILSVQFGAGIAKSLFDEISPTAIVFLRLASSAVVLALISRPVLRGRSREDWLVVVGFGVALALMNWSIYQAFSRIPLGLAVTIEFIGPLTLAVAGSRKASDLLWVLLAGLGVALLGVRGGGLDLLGVVYALVAGASWAAYILLSVQTGRRWEGLAGLGTASVIAALLLVPTIAASHAADLLDTRILLLGALIGLLSSVVPYAFDLIALRSLAPAVYGILMSVEPAAAALAGLLLLGEFLSPLQWTAIACVVAASVGATRSGRALVSELPPD